MKVFLIGFMGVGKSTLGKLLAENLKLPFIDLDENIESAEGVTLVEMFEDGGERDFRKIETEHLNQIIENNESFLLACGGGTPCFDDNLYEMQEAGIVVWLDMPVVSLVHRLKEFKAKRPLIAKLDREGMIDYVSGLFSKRRRYYSKAHIHFQVDEKNSDDFLLLSKEIEAYRK